MGVNKCIIIDDDPFAIEGLNNFIGSIPNLSVNKSYTDPLQALLYFSTIDMIDLILLDIHMPKINGIELSKEIRRKTRKLVFTTSYTKYGYEAFEAEADAYLLKPFTLLKFTATMLKLFPNESTSGLSEKQEVDYFFVKNRDDNMKIVKIRFDEVIAIESKQNYVLLHTFSKKVVTYMSLTEISKMFTHLPNFDQFQRSFIICKDHIDFILGNTIKMVNGLELTVGDYYRKDFMQFLTGRLINARRNE